MLNKLLGILLLIYSGTISEDKYIGMGVGRFSDGIEGFANATAFHYYFGNRISRHLAVELSFTRASEVKDSLDLLFLNQETISVKTKLILEPAEGVETYLVFGAHHLEVEIGENVSGQRVTIDSQDGLWGAGVHVELSRGFYIGLEHLVFEIFDIRIKQNTLNLEFHF